MKEKCRVFANLLQTDKGEDKQILKAQLPSFSYTCKNLCSSAPENQNKHGGEQCSFLRFIKK